VRLRCRREDEAAIFTAAADHEAFGHLGEVACPVTLACGRETDAFGPRLMQADAAPLPDSRVEVLPGMGHFGPLQRPAAVADSIVAAFGPPTKPVDGTPPS
jgi:pimeloyl-ACP methyl ester carboxylesterase